MNHKYVLSNLKKLNVAYFNNDDFSVKKKPDVTSTFYYPLKILITTSRIWLQFMMLINCRHLSNIELFLRKLYYFTVKCTALGQFDV